VREAGVIRPSQEEFEALTTRGNLIPVVREILADLDTPLSLFRRLDDGRTSFLLESVEGGEKWARYSFIGTGARAGFRADRKPSGGATVTWTEGGVEQTHEVEGDPLEFLRDKLALLQHVNPDNIALPRFIGGAVGMVGYDWVRFVEKLPEPNPAKQDIPVVSFVFPETVVVYDNIKHTALVVRHVHMKDGDDSKKRYVEASKAIDATIVKLRAPFEQPVTDRAVKQPMDVARNMTEAEFHKIVKRAKEYILAGDIFQVVLSQTFEMPLQVEAFEIYRQLRSINPSPYLYFVRQEGTVLVGSSPEILVRLEDDRLDVRPIAGTRRRGRDEAHDLAMEEELLSDPKEIAEHVMLVDLGRNDAGRVAEIGTVEVTEYGVIERYSHVMHIVSNVQAKLKKGLDWLDVLRATFPAGTLSGAPKVRAMEIIDELENVGRGPYGGCVGYIDYSGNMDMAITIRTLVVKDGRITLQAGAGVVADSVPALEHLECANKAQALIAAIDLSREGCD
jgi:anthranilate synthase component 1